MTDKIRIDGFNVARAVIELADAASEETP